MTIRAWASALALIPLAACEASPEGAPADDAGQKQVVAMLQVEDCLPALWRDRADRDEDYDRAHDRLAGGTLSCGLSITASEMRDFLADLRAAAAAGDREALLDHVSVPMTYVDREGSVRRLPTRADVAAIYDDVFTDDVLKKLASLRLEDASVVPNEGLFFELGAVWLVIPEGDASPQVLTVNLQASAEAEAAAILKAVEGTAVPPTR